MQDVFSPNEHPKKPVLAVTGTAFPSFLPNAMNTSSFKFVPLQLLQSRLHLGLSDVLSDVHPASRRHVCEQHQDHEERGLG